MYFKDTILQEAEIKALKPSKNKQYEFKSCVNKVIAKLGFAATDHKFTNGSKFKFKGYSATVLAEDMKKQASKIDKEHTNAFKSIGCKEIDVKLGKAGHSQIFYKESADKKNIFCFYYEAPVALKQAQGTDADKLKLYFSKLGKLTLKDLGYRVGCGAASVAVITAMFKGLGVKGMPSVYQFIDASIKVAFNKLPIQIDKYKRLTNFVNAIRAAKIIGSSFTVGTTIYCVSIDNNDYNRELLGLSGKGYEEPEEDSGDSRTESR